MTTWTVGDPEPPNSDIREVTGKSGTTWIRSKPNGHYWAPEGGGLIHHWPEVLRVDGPVTGEPTQGLLFQIGAP